MAEQLAYPSATVETARGAGSWVIVDPALQATAEHEVLNDIDDATWVESDGTWAGGARPSFVCRVQTLAGKLPLRVPHLAATLFRFKFRYRISGSVTFGVGPMIEALDYASDSSTINGSIPFPGRRSVLFAQTFTSELIYDGAIHELEMTLPGYMLRGHEDGCRSIGNFLHLTGGSYDTDLGFRFSVPSLFTGSGKLQVLGCWYRVDEVERYESVGADWLVVRAGAGDYRTVDLKGNWAGTPGQVFTTLFDEGSTLSTAAKGLVDACRRAGMTKQFSGTAIVETDPSCFANAQSNITAQPNFGGITFGGRSGSSVNYVYWLAGTPASPGGLVPVDGLVVRAPPVVDGYRDGNDRPSLQTPTLGYHYDGTYVEHGTMSFYGVRYWVSSGGVQGVFSDNAGGKPNSITTWDSHDFQVTGDPLNSQGQPKTNNAEFVRGFRMGGVRLDLRRGRFGRSSEHSIYTTTPPGDSQLIDCENTFAAEFYPKHLAASTQANNPNTFHQFVMRTNSCTNNGNPPGCTPQGRGILLVQGCTSRNTGGTDYKCVHSLGSIINRRCRTFGGAGTQRAIQFTVESFGQVAQAPNPTLFGVDYSIGSFDGAPSMITCTKGGGSGQAKPMTPYPSQVPGNGPLVYCFAQVIIEDLEVNGPCGNTVCQIAGADSIIIDRGQNNSGKWPFFGFWEWGYTNNLASWQNGGAGAFDNHSVYFRNVGSNPHSYYGAPTTTQGGPTVSRLAVYGARSNPNQPSGAPNIAYHTIAQLSAMAVAGNSAYPAWYQTQEVDAGAGGANLGHDWIFPCVTAPDFDDPAVYGGYFGNARRYPNKNTLGAGMDFEWEAPSPTVTLGTGGAVTVTPALAEFEFEAPAPTVQVSVTVTHALPEYEFEGPVPAVTLAVSVAPSLPEYEFEGPVPIVTLGETLDFSLFPAIMELDVGIPTILSELAAGEANTEAVSVAGAASGGAG